MYPALATSVLRKSETQPEKSTVDKGQISRKGKKRASHTEKEEEENATASKGIRHGPK